MTMGAGEKLPRFEDIESKVMQFDRSIESVPAQGGYADICMSKNSFLICS